MTQASNQVGRRGGRHQIRPAEVAGGWGRPRPRPPPAPAPWLLVGGEGPFDWNIMYVAFRLWDSEAVDWWRTLHRNNMKRWESSGDIRRITIKAAREEKLPREAPRLAVELGCLF